MKKIGIYILTVIIILQIVNSLEDSTLSIKGAIDNMKNELDGEDKLLYIANPSDDGSFIAIQKALFADIMKENGLLGYFSKFTTDEIAEDDLYDRNVILVGGPCANKYWTFFSNEETCDNWPYEPGQSIVKVLDNNGYLVILVAGTDIKDTWEIARLVMKYEDVDEFTTNNEFVYSSPSKRIENVQVKCNKDFVCFSFHYNAEFVYKKDNFEYSIILTNIDESNNIITFELNNDPYSLEIGESIEVNGIMITPRQIEYNPISAEAQSVEFHFSESMEGFKPFGVRTLHSSNCMDQGGLSPYERELIYLEGNNVPFDTHVNDISESDKLDITINGKRYTGMYDGDIIDDINGYSVSVQEITTSFDRKYARLCFD